MAAQFYEYNNDHAREIIEKLYLNANMADVFFTFSNGDSTDLEKVPAHKIILSAGSLVFETMFHENGDIPIVDVSVKAFQEFLQFFYLQKVQLTLENIAAVAILCRIHDLRDGLKACEIFLRKVTTPENVCWAYGIAMSLKLDDLIEFCENNIVKSGSKVIKSSGFLESNRDLLAHVWPLAKLKCFAWDLVCAAMAWAEAECMRKDLDPEPVNLRAELDDFYDQIPFSELTMVQFTQHIASFRGFFTVAELQEFIQKISSTTEEPETPKLELSVVEETVHLDCDRRSSNDIFRSITQASTTFSVNKKMVLTGFSVYFKPQQGCRKDPIHFEMIYKRHDLDKAVYLIRNLQLNVRKNENELHVVLKRCGVVLTTEGFYRIQARIPNSTRLAQLTDNKFSALGQGIEVKFKVGAWTNSDFITRLNFKV